MRKFLAALFGLACVTCVAAATACATVEPEYYTLTYEEPDGVTFDFNGILSGAEVREGYTVNFTVHVDDDLEGTPVVNLNEQELTAGADGGYSFVMKGESKITVSGVMRISTHSVFFEAGDVRVRYFGTDEAKTEYTDVKGLSYDLGATVSFTLKKSVYYMDGSYKVTANSIILEPDDKGVYSFEVMADTNVSVEGLEEDLGFTARAGGGSGTEADPYLIEKPIDMYYMAALVEDSAFYNGRFARAHYKLMNDLDFEGEQLYIVGNFPGDNTLATFSGEFDGNGHTISNYYIDDHVINQENGEEVPLSYIGLFGFATVTAVSRAYIHDLTLRDFEIEVDAANVSSGYYVGGLVGAGMGVEINNCSVEGEITVYGNNDTFGYVGGIIGRQQSYYDGASMLYTSYVGSCEANVNITCSNGNFYAAGGISGIAISATEDVNSSIMNSCFTGDVSGALNTGGIAGLADSYTSVVNCYTTGEVFARSAMTVVNGQYTYSHASGGGIVGYLGSDAIISSCFSVAEVGASAALGAKYEHTGGIAGRLDDSGGLFVNSLAPALHNNYSGADVRAEEEFYKNTLGWTDGAWSFGNGYPTLKRDEISGGYAINVVFPEGLRVGGADSVLFEGNENTTIAALYAGGVDRFLTSDNGLRSYGYFFDRELKNPVYSSYVPLGSVTLYAGFADYSEVAGRYYILGGGNNSYIELGTDGSLGYRLGALDFTSFYSYDGKEILLQPCPAATLTIDDGENVTSTYVTAIAPKAAGRLVFEFSYRTSLTEAPAAGSFTAVSAVNGFEYGSYYAEGSDDYTFNYNGTGTKGNSSFVFTVSSNGQIITITLANGNKELAQLSENGGFEISDRRFVKYDEFRGTWEKAYTTHETFTFDGRGGWSFEKFVYDSKGVKQNIERSSGGYTIADGKLALDNGYIAGFDGVCLGIDNGNYSEAFYREYSFVGEWGFLSLHETVTAVFGGLNAEGYGEASIAYGTGDAIAMSYEVLLMDGAYNIYLIKGEDIYGQLTFNPVNGTLNGLIYSQRKNNLVDALFCIYDDFKGLWVSSELGDIEFNGLGNYDIAGTANYSQIIGVIKIGGKTAGTYELEDFRLSGSFSYNNIDYTIIYNPETGSAEIKAEGSSDVISAVRPDDMRGIVLVDGDGTLYSFDGGSYLASGGKLTVTGADGTTVYGYAEEDKFHYAITAQDGTAGSLVLENGVYSMTLGEDVKTLTVSNPFTGSWIKGGAEVGSLEISVINGDLLAEGSYLGEEVSFTYNPAGGYLSFRHDGKTLYILALGSGDRTELAVSESADTRGEHDLCLKASALDKHAGAYTAADGAMVVLDGLTTSTYGTGNGTASVWDKDGKLTATYSYKLNSLGELELKGDKTFIFAEEENGAYVLDGKSFTLIEADWFYQRSIVDSAKNSYVFDGHGTVRVSDGKVYSYVIKGYDDVSLVYSLEFTDADGGKREAEYDLALAKLIFAGESNNA